MATHSGDMYPNFTWQLTNPYNEPYGWVKADGVVIHNISNLPDFYSALGYTQCMEETSVLPDEFVWAEYGKYKSVIPPVCQQVLITEYLKKNSSGFRDKYEVHHSGWIRGCTVEKKMSNAVCNRCHLHSINRNNTTLI